MRFEKATSRSSEASLAGWISSNDVTLFTVVLVLVIAMFLQTRLSKGARESFHLGQEKDSLAENLQTRTDELDASRNALERTLADLNLTQEQRDQLRQQLVEKLEALARLNEKLDLLLKEKGALELEQQSLLAAKASLTQEQASLVSERDSLTNEKGSLEDRLVALSQQLAEKLAALEGAEQERDRLKKQADELDAIVAGLKKRMDELNIHLTESQQRAEAAGADSATKIHDLETRLAASDERAEDLLAKLKRAAELFQGLQQEKKQLQTALSDAEQRRQAELLEEGRNNRELVGLTGRLERVAILFDASGSMRQQGASGVGDRWAEAQSIAARWLQHLNVQQCALIVFSTDVRTFPEDGTLTDVQGEDGKARREALLQHLTSITPGGWTNTYDALAKAYQYDIDTILLFTDGAPSKSNSGVFDAALAEQIYTLCRAHPNIPVHTIGLGNYFDANAATFLQSLAKLTGGSFRGW